MEPTRQVTTPELKSGDIVLVSGIEVLLDEDESTHYEDGTTEVTAWRGIVINIAHVRASHAVPLSWLYEGPLDSNGWPVNSEQPRWSVMGNVTTTWTVLSRSGD